MTTPLTITDAAAALRGGTLTSADLVEASLDAITTHGGATNAFIRVDADAARRAAHMADADRSRGVDHGPLHGVPISVKDLIDIAGEPTTAASRVLFDRIPTRDATVTARLKSAGAVLIGKTNLHEFALGTTSEDSAWGPVKNPLDLTRSAGGSSGGSAAAVATGMGLASIGTDTGGSIRIPAAACGVVGLKPSVGEVPTDGVVPLSISLDHVGPLTRTVQDAATLWAVLAGRPIAPIERRDPSTLRLCQLTGYFGAPIDEHVREGFFDALDRLRDARVVVAQDALANTLTIAETYANLVLPEGALWHSRYLDSRAAEYSPVVRARLDAGRVIHAIAYLRARQARQAWQAAVDAVLGDYDALVLPTLPIVAPPLGLSDIVIDHDQGESVPVRMAMLRQTQLFNITGHPAISLPVKTSGLPVGLQLVGRRGETARLLAVAAACESLI